jgi:hypothetical protein
LNLWIDLLRHLPAEMDIHFGPCGLICRLFVNTSLMTWRMSVLPSVLSDLLAHEMI